MADVVKYGIQIPNRIFVGGIAFDTKEEELKDFFQQHGKVKDCKIVADKDGFSRGFGFVTFESKQEAIQTQKLGTVFFNQKKLNLGPAIRQKGVVFNGAQEAANEPVTSAGVYIHPSGYCYTVAPNGVWYFHANGSNAEDGQPVTQVVGSSTPNGNTSAAPLKPRTVNIPPPVPVQTSTVPMTIIPAENMQQRYPVNGHYIMPQTVSVINNNAPEMQRTEFVPDPNFAPYYVYSQPQQPMPHMNGYPISSPPPPQIHRVAPPVHMIRGPYPTPQIPAGPRPEVYQVLTAPYDPSIIEQGPFVHTNRSMPQNIMKPAFMRPTGPMKRVSAEFPPQIFQLRRNYEAPNYVNSSNVMSASSISNGSTPSSFSSSIESDIEIRDESK